MMSIRRHWWRRVRRFTVGVLVMSLGGLFGPAPGADAHPNVEQWQGVSVANPGPFTLASTGGLIAINVNEFDLTPTGPQCSDGIDNEGDDLGVPDGLIDFPDDPECTSPDDDSELASGYQPYQETTIGGTIDGGGNVVLPAAETDFAPAWLWGGDLVGIVTVTIEATADGTGTLNPRNGATEMTVRLRAHIEGNLVGGNCAIGTAGDPITATLITGTTDPPPPNRPITGELYNQYTGTATVVDNGFAVPGASGCGPFGIYNGIVNGMLGLPSPAGTNTVILSGAIDPIIKAGVSMPRA